MTLAESFTSVRARIARAEERAGRAPGSARLIAVSKTVSYEAVLRSEELGQRDFGENRVDELARKRAHCPDDRFHFIGSLQTNKVRKVVGEVVLIHSVDSLHLLEAIDRRAAYLGIAQPVLLQVNIAHEEQKHGFEAAEMPVVIRTAAALEHIEVNGLMTMAPNLPAEHVRWVFGELRNLCDTLRDQAHEEGLDRLHLKELSMGMTNDFEVAVEEGATLVRVGSALYRDFPPIDDTK